MRFNDFGVIGEIDNLPGCSQIAVFHSVFLPQELRGQGLGHKAHDARLKRARELGYQVAVCTVVGDNHAQRQILKEYGWDLCLHFKSNKTDHYVELYTKEL